MTQRIDWAGRAAKDLDAFDRELRQRILSAVEKMAQGEGDVRRLKDITPPLFRLRVGDYRVLFRYEAGTVVVLRVLPRDKAYR
jgi:mRNA interferase RelE/StbE